MEITLTVNVAGGQRRFGVLVDALKDLTPVLREFDKYKRQNIAELFESQGHGKWPPRSERAEQAGAKRTIDAREAAPRGLLRKLSREHQRARIGAERKDAKVGFFRSLTKKSRAASERRQNTVARRAFVLGAFQEHIAGELPNLAGFESRDRRLQKSVRGLEQRLGRAQERADAKGKVLGDLPRTIRSTLSNGRLVIDSAWESPAVAVLNDGGTVGRGAKVPARTYLEWTEDDVEHLASLFKARAMLAWRS